MTDVVHLGEADFLQIEEFISRTPRGRAFLREHRRRAQGDLAGEIRVLLGELREQWRQQNEAGSLASRIAALRHELQDMSASISQARREIAAIKPAGAGKDRILSATNELDAIILSTEHASTEILSSAERILDLIGRLRAGAPVEAVAADIEEEVTNVFTACSFQDLTGQRTTKVINALRYIEQRIAALIALWGLSEADSENAPPAAEDGRPDGHLLHGPDSDGIDQSQVDRLLAGDDPMPSAPAGSRPEPARRQAADDPGGQPSGLDQSAIDALFG
jgi:chemotaxis regulatin CheY-phosphate phosphatase CheZ